MPLLCFGLTHTARADQLKVPGYLVAKPPVIDGRIDEAEWALVPKMQGTYDDQTGDPCPEASEFWLAYDAKYVYFAARLQDHDPHSIHATQYQTNVNLNGDDYVSLNLDLNGSMSSFNVFGINPRGATSIALAGGRAVKREWSGDYTAASRITSDGWEVEARIPWQVMPLPTAGKRDIRFNIMRFLQKTQRSYSVAFIPPGKGAETPIWIGIPIPKANAVRYLQLLPYGYTGYDDKTRGRAVFNTGVDLKTELTDKINLVGTINPDFRNIENQILSIDFSRFERLAGESRPFFQEGRQYLSTAIFASQRIRHFDVGINTYGRINDKTSFGLIETLAVHHENDVAANFTFDPTPNDHYRASFTNLSRPDLENSAYVFRYSKQVGAHNVFLRTMGSQDSKQSSGYYDSAYYTWNKKEWNLFTGYDYVSPNFLPRLGFFPEVDYKGPQVNLSYDKPLKKGALSEYGANLYLADYTHTHGGQYRRDLDVSGTISLRSGLDISYDHFRERFEGQNDKTDNIGFSFPRDNRFKRIGVGYTWGELAGVRYTNTSINAAYRFNQRLQTDLAYQIVHHGETEDQLILTGSYDLGKFRTLSGRLVKHNNNMNGFLSFSQSGNRGAEYYFIIGNPNAERFRASLILKVVVPFQIKIA